MYTQMRFCVYIVTPLSIKHIVASLRNNGIEIRNVAVIKERVAKRLSSSGTSQRQAFYISLVMKVFGHNQY